MVELAVGQRCEIEITDLSHDGHGIGRCGAAVVFVQDALPGERVEALVLRRVRHHWLARLERIVQSSPQRQRPPCILASRCGGCSLQHLQSEGQQQWKRHCVITSLERLAGLRPAVQPMVGARMSLGYRNRAIIPLERTERGEVRCGYYRRHSHRIVNLNHCPVLDARLDALVAPIKGDCLDFCSIHIGASVLSTLFCHEGWREGSQGLHSAHYPDSRARCGSRWISSRIVNSWAFKRRCIRTLDCFTDPGVQRIARKNLVAIPMSAWPLAAG